jgi:hypothetical protein
LMKIHHHHHYFCVGYYDLWRNEIYRSKTIRKYEICSRKKLTRIKISYFTENQRFYYDYARCKRKE